MVYMLLGTGFEETEAIAPCDLLRRAGVEIKLVGIRERRVVGSHGICVEADMTLEEADLSRAEMIVLPGGLRGVQSLLDCEPAMRMTKQAWEAGKYVAAICAAPTILAGLGITGTSRATCYPGMEDRMGPATMVPASVVADGRLITGRAAGSALDFGLALIRALKDDETADRVAQGVVYSAN